MPLALGRDVVGLAPGETTLATVLRDSGYATAAFSAGNPYISPRFGYERGFELFNDFLAMESHSAAVDAAPEAAPPASSRGKLNRAMGKTAEALGMSRLYQELYFQYCMKIAPSVESIDILRRFPSADALVDCAQSWLSALGQRPFFLWLHLMDPHSPYYPRQEAFREMTGGEIAPRRARYLNKFWQRSDLAPSGFQRKRNAVMELYDAGLRWVDSEIARLVSGLRQMHLWDDCVFAVTADHGEEFLEHGGRYHAPLHLSEEMVRVPLLLRVPGEKAGKLPSSPMSHLHLAPTLLESIGVHPPSAFRGRSLWANLRQGVAWDDPAIIECVYGCTNPFRTENRSAPRLLAVRDARFKLVMRIEPGAAEEIYDLEIDPLEMHPCGNGPGFDARRKLLHAAHDHLQRTVSELDREMRLAARLRHLRFDALSRIETLPH